jgi:hypothetical protein
MISQTVITPKVKNKPKPKAIKSYIYTPPKVEKLSKPPILIEEVTESVAENTTTTESKIKENKKKQVETPKESIEPVESIKTNEPIETTEKKEVPVKSVTPKKAKRSFSAYGQLKNLQKDLDDKMFEQENNNYNQPNTGSIMHSKPTLVPHSNIQITAEEKVKKASKQISSDMTITKGDDGSCFIKRDLGSVGMEGITSVESFACGKSKFDKSFQDHMKKVRAKLGKK